MTAPFDATSLLTLLDAARAVPGDATVEQLIASTVPALRKLLGGDVDVQLDADGTPVLVGVHGTFDPEAVEVVTAIVADQVRLRRAEIRGAASVRPRRRQASAGHPRHHTVRDPRGRPRGIHRVRERCGGPPRPRRGPSGRPALVTNVNDLRIIALDGTPRSPDELQVNHAARSGTTQRDRISGIVAADGSVTWVLATYELCGLPVGSEVDLWTFTNLTHPDDRATLAAAAAAVREAVSERRRVTRKVRVTRPDGVEVLFSLIGEPVIENDRVIRVVGVVRDVTAETADEERLRRIQQLESVGRLAGGLAHDLNNLLTVLSGHAELLAMTVTDEDRPASRRSATRPNAPRPSPASSPRSGGARSSSRRRWRSTTCCDGCSRPTASSSRTR